MSKKVILIILLVVVVVIGLYCYFNKYQSGLILDRGSGIEMENNQVDPKNCTYTIENKQITLKNGYAEEEIVPGSASKLITQYFGNSVSGDFNGDKLTDTAFLLTQSQGGSGTFYYIAVALGSKNGCKGINAIYLGDRIAPQTTSFDSGNIVVNYAERKADEPMTTPPSVGVTRYFSVVNNGLVEVQK